MPAIEEKAVRLVEITQRKANELFSELIVELRESVIEIQHETLDLDTNIALDDREGEPEKPSGYETPWSFDDVTLPEGGWTELSRIDDGETYGWPDGSTDHYHPYTTYRGTGGLSEMTLGLGFKNDGVVVGFVVNPASGAKRGITVFFPATDFAKSNEKISMIRGGGKRGRAGFGEGNPLPAAYQGFRVEMLRNRVAGKWNVQAVVADADDHDAMLRHTALQARLRGLM